jgi:hypothetical protein
MDAAPLPSSRFESLCLASCLHTVDDFSLRSLSCPNPLSTIDPGALTTLDLRSALN